MKIDSFWDILFILYSCFFILTLVKRMGIYSFLRLNRIRNLYLLGEGFLILGTLAIVQEQFLKVDSILLAIIFGSIFACSDFFIKLKNKNLKNGICIIDLKGKQYRKLQKKYRIVIVFAIIIVGIIYSKKYGYSTYVNIITSLVVLSGLIGGTLYLLFIVLAEKKYGPIFYEIYKSNDSQNLNRGDFNGQVQ